MDGGKYSRTDIPQLHRKFLRLDESHVYTISNSHGDGIDYDGMC